MIDTYPAPDEYQYSSTHVGLHCQKVYSDTLIAKCLPKDSLSNAVLENYGENGKQQLNFSTPNLIFKNI